MALRAVNPNCSFREFGKILIEDADDHLDILVITARFDGDLQVERVVLRCQDDRLGTFDPGGLQRGRTGGVILDDRDLHVLDCRDHLGARLQFDHDHVFLHGVQLLDHPETEMSQPDQDGMFAVGGSNGHFPLLAACPAVEQHHTEFGQPLGQRNDADDRQQKIKDLQD